MIETTYILAKIHIYLCEINSPLYYMMSYPHLLRVVFIRRSFQVNAGPGPCFTTKEHRVYKYVSDLINVHTVLTMSLINSIGICT